VRPGQEVANATVLIENGRITAVGSALELPSGTRELRGEVVCAGFIDPWSSLALIEPDLTDQRANSATRTVDAIDSFLDRRRLEELLRAGITGVRTQVGATAHLGGIGAFQRVHPGRPLRDSVVLEDCCVAASVGITREGRGQDIFERLGEIDRLVGELKEAQAYLVARNEYGHDLTEWRKKIAEKTKELEDGFKKAKKDREKEQADAKAKGKEFKEKEYKEDKPPAEPKPDDEKAALARAVAGELPLIVEVHRNAELRALLEGTRDLERLRLIIAGGSEAASVADELAERGVPVLVWPVTHAGRLDAGQARPGEFREADLSLASELRSAGVEVLLGSGGAFSAGSRDLPLLAALAVGHGLDPVDAFEALTVGAAAALDVGDRLGTVELGKDADLLVLDGEPLSTSTRVLHAIVAGDVVWSAQ
jgi:imidazolonepropionase-like amidohydrolase